MDINEIIQFLFTPMAQIGLIIGIAEVFKKIGFKVKYIPLLDVILGLISGIGVYGLMMGYGIQTGAVVGIALGLSACGLFSGIKNVKEELE